VFIKRQISYNVVMTSGSTFRRTLDAIEAPTIGATFRRARDYIEAATTGSTFRRTLGAVGIPDLLVSKHKGAGNAAVYSLSGGTTLTQIGSDFSIGSLEAPDVSGANTYKPHGHVLEFQGKRIVWHRNTIREENTGGAGTWGIVHTISDMLASNGYGQHTGIHLVQVRGAPALVGLYKEVTTNDTNVLESTDGITWTQVGTIMATGSNAVGRSIIFRNKLYWRIGAAGTEIICYDPLLRTASLIETGFAAAALNIDFCVLDNNLYMAGTIGSSSGDLFGLYRLDGSIFTNIHTFSTQDNGSSGEDGACVLFTDNTNLYAILTGEASGLDGNAMFKIEDPGGAGQTVTDITNPVIPSQYRSGGGSANEINHWSVFVNNDSRPNLPEIYLWRLQSFATGTHDAYQYVNDFTELTSLGTGPSDDIYLPHTHFGGGERIALTDKIYAEIAGNATVVDGTELSYRVYGTSLGAGTIKLYYSMGEETPNIQATLTGTATGGSSVRSGNEIQNVNADAAATLYTLIWDNISDGIVETDMVNLMLSI
jgi:hypothetical protein